VLSIRVYMLILVIYEECSYYIRGMLLHIASFQPRDTAYCIISNNSYTQIIRTPPVSNKNICKCKNEIIILAIHTGKVNGLLSWLMVGTLSRRRWKACTCNTVLITFMLVFTGMLQVSRGVLRALRAMLIVSQHPRWCAHGNQSYALPIQRDIQSIRKYKLVILN